MPLRLLTITCFALAFAGEAVRASPPVDLSDYAEARKVSKRTAKPLTDQDLIYTDNILSPEKLMKGLVLFKKATLGRRAARADGAPILRFRAEYRARLLKLSRDKKWVAVELLNGKRRAWVDKDSVELLDETAAKEAPPSDD